MQGNLSAVYMRTKMGELDTGRTPTCNLPYLLQLWDVNRYTDSSHASRSQEE